MFRRDGSTPSARELVTAPKPYSGNSNFWWENFKFTLMDYSGFFISQLVDWRVLGETFQYSGRVFGGFGMILEQEHYPSKDGGGNTAGRHL